MVCSSRSAKVKVVGRRWGVAALDGIGLRNVEKLELELELESERRSSNLQSNPSVRAHTVSLSHSPPAKCAARRAEEARRRRQPIPARFFLACAPLIIHSGFGGRRTNNESTMHPQMRTRLSTLWCLLWLSVRPRCHAVSRRRPAPCVALVPGVGELCVRLCLCARRLDGLLASCQSMDWRLGRNSSTPDEAAFCS